MPGLDCYRYPPKWHTQLTHSEKLDVRSGERLQTGVTPSDGTVIDAASVHASHIKLEDVLNDPNAKIKLEEFDSLIESNTLDDSQRFTLSVAVVNYHYNLSEEKENGCGRLPFSAPRSAASINWQCRSPISAPWARRIR